MILLAGSSNISLAQRIAQDMQCALGEIELSSFGNGERRVYVKEEVKGHDIALIQSFSDPVDTHIIESALITDALFRAGARRVFAVVPWFGYSLQDKVFRSGEPIAAKVIASMLSSQSIYRFILMNLHNSSISGFFSVPSSVLSSDDLFAQDIEKLAGEKILVSSDFGGLKRVGRFAKKLDLDIANIDKRRDLHTGEVVAHALSGDVSGKTAIIIDDIINSGSTLIEAARILRQQGAKTIVAYATHALFAGDALERITESELDEVIVTDTVDMTARTTKNLRTISVSSLFANELLQWAR